MWSDRTWTLRHLRVAKCPSADRVDDTSERSSLAAVLRASLGLLRLGERQREGAREIEKAERVTAQRGGGGCCAVEHSVDQPRTLGSLS
jgi:hypothetical protein